MAFLIRHLALLCATLLGLAAAPAAWPANAPPPLPAEVRTAHQVVLAGKPLRYVAAAGALTLKEASGERVGDMAYVAYMAEGADAARRPITFVFSGGPGYSSAELHLGLAGPVMLKPDAWDAGVVPGSPPLRADNPQTWLAFTDLVFVDAIGTGWSQAAGDAAMAEKVFFGWKRDIAWLSRFVADWLARNNRMASPKYLAGESYGGFRVPQIAYHLQLEEGVGLAGLVMISPVIDFSLRLSTNGPMDWVARLPVMAAARLERDTGRDVDVRALADAQDYALGDYLRDLMRPQSDTAAQQRMAGRVAALSGLDEALVRRLSARIDPATFNREFRRGQGLVGSRYEASRALPDPYAERTANDTVDPTDAYVAPIASALVDHVNNTLHWRPDAPFHYADRSISKRWQYPSGRVDGSEDLRKALALDPQMRLLVAHGATDFVTPYLASKIILDQFSPVLAGTRVQLKLYPGGHAFYARPASRSAFTADVKALYERQ
jgi:carboxypeptidase C (cathepsin A)